MAIATKRRILKLRDTERLDWMERQLQHPATVQMDGGGSRNVNAWALVGQPGLSLRETVDAMMRNRPAA